jgi:hypothetical protein
VAAFNILPSHLNRLMMPIDFSECTSVSLDFKDQAAHVVVRVSGPKLAQLGQRDGLE